MKIKSVSVLGMIKRNYYNLNDPITYTDFPYLVIIASICNYFYVIIFY